MLQYRPNRRYDKENYSLNTNYFLQFKCKNIFLPFQFLLNSWWASPRRCRRRLKTIVKNFNPPPLITGPHQNLFTSKTIVHFNTLFSKFQK